MVDFKEALDKSRQQRAVAGQGVSLVGRQLTAYQRAMDGSNLFITGPGGTGKSEVTKALVRDLRAQGKRVAVTASTGIAAVAIGGMTIHSVLGLGIAANRDEAVKRLGAETIQKVQQFLYHIDTIVLDEVSMITGDYIQMMQWWLNMVKESRPGHERPFGGYQMVFVGDFLQLPPVIKDGVVVRHKYAFQAPAWQEGGIEEVYLNESHRQADPEMFKHLCRIRRGLVEDDTVEFFRPCHRRELDEPTALFGTNADAASLNQRRLAALPGEVHAWEAHLAGNPKWYRSLADNCIAEQVLELKVGAPVIFIKNNRALGYVNGERGTVTEATSEHAVVRKDNGDEVVVTRETWEVCNADARVLASLSQLPLKLAWALTIHKSQGMSLDRVRVDLAGCFERGQAYVALSRARSAGGLSLSTLPSEVTVRASGKVVEYYRGLARRMRAAEQASMEAAGQ